MSYQIDEFRLVDVKKVDKLLDGDIEQMRRKSESEIDKVYFIQHEGSKVDWLIKEGKIYYRGR